MTALHFPYAGLPARRAVAKMTIVDLPLVVVAFRRDFALGLALWRLGGLFEATRYEKSARAAGAGNL